MDRIYKDSIISYAFLFGFLFSSQNEINFQIEKIIEENINKQESLAGNEKEKINMESKLIIYEQEKNQKKEDSWFFVINIMVFFVLVSVIFFDPTKEKKEEKKKTPGIYLKKVNKQQTKLELFLGKNNQNDNPVRSKYFENFFEFFANIFQVLTQDVNFVFDHKEYVQVLKFENMNLFRSITDLEFFQPTFKNSRFFNDNKIYYIDEQAKIIEDPKQIEILKTIQEIKIEEAIKKIFPNHQANQKNTVFLQSYFALLSIETFFNLTLSANEVLFAEQTQNLPTENGSYFISGFDAKQIPTVAEYNQQTKYKKLYHRPLLLSIENATKTYESNAFLLFIFIICYDKEYLDPIGTLDSMFKIQHPEITKINYDENGEDYYFYYYFGKNFFSIFCPYLKETQIFDLRRERKNPTFDFVKGTPSDTILCALRNIYNEHGSQSLKFLTEYIMNKKYHCKDFGDLNHICFSRKQILKYVSQIKQYMGVRREK